MKLSGYHLFSGIILAAALAAPFTFAQGVFEGSGEVSDPNCVGDGCGFVPAEQAENQNDQFSSEESSGEVSSTEAQNTGLDSDSTAADSAVAVNTTNIDEEDDDRPHYINESADEYRARKEGFSKGMQFGIRLGVGASKIFGTKDENWNLGFEGNGGLMTRLLLGRTIGIATELNFSYRHYSYEAKTSYSRNKATIDEMLFEIPVMGQYIFDDDGFFVGLGVNIGLKMSGDSEFKQDVTTDNDKAKENADAPVPNPLPTEGVEIGGLFDIGYIVNRNFMVDLRVVQNFTNLLDLDLIAESTLMHSKLYTMHVTLGVSFLL